MLITKLLLEKLNREGVVLDRREQLSRSFVLQFMDLLYSKAAQINRATRDVDNVLRTVPFTDTGNALYNLGIASPGGDASCYNRYDYGRKVMAEKIGIQVGAGTSAPAPTNYKLANRIAHGRSKPTAAPATFNNLSFETGDLTGWTPATKGGMAAVVRNDAWAIKNGTWFCALWTTGVVVPGDYAQISQDIDLTNITHIRFQLRGQKYVSSYNGYFNVLISGRPVYFKELANNVDYPDETVVINTLALTGVQTVTFVFVAEAGQSASVYFNSGAWVDNIRTLNAVSPLLEYGGCDVSDFLVAPPNAQFTIRRYFYNNSSALITVNEVGIQAVAGAAPGYAFLIARDEVSPGIGVAVGELLRVTYVPQITV